MRERPSRRIARYSVVLFVCKVTSGEVNQLGPSLPFLFCSSSGVIYGALTFPGLCEVIVILKKGFKQAPPIEISWSAHGESSARNYP